MDIDYGAPMVYSWTRGEKLADADYLIRLLTKYLEEMKIIKVKMSQSDSQSQKNARRTARLAHLRYRCMPFVLGWLNRYHPSVEIDSDLIEELSAF